MKGNAQMDIDISTISDTTSNTHRPQSQSSSQREGVIGIQQQQIHSIIEAFEEFMMDEALEKLKHKVADQLQSQTQEINWQQAFTHFQTNAFTLLHSLLISTSHPIITSHQINPNHPQRVLEQLIRQELELDADTFSESDVLELFQTMVSFDAFKDWATDIFLSNHSSPSSSHPLQITSSSSSQKNTKKDNDDDDPFGGLLVIRPMSRK